MDNETDADRLEIALEMWEDGVAIMRENLRRRAPDATEQEIELALDAWLVTRPGAEHGDAEGVVAKVATLSKLTDTLRDLPSDRYCGGKGSIRLKSCADSSGWFTRIRNGLSRPVDSMANPVTLLTIRMVLGPTSTLQRCRGATALQFWSSTRASSASLVGSAQCSPPVWRR